MDVCPFYIGFLQFYNQLHCFVDMREHVLFIQDIVSDD